MLENYNARLQEIGKLNYNFAAKLQSACTWLPYFITDLLIKNICTLQL